MNQIISCDWGTSSLRLRLVEMGGLAGAGGMADGPGEDGPGAGDQRVLAQVMSPLGIAGTFESWKQSGKGEAERVSFYLSVLKGQIGALEERVHSSLQHIPLVVSGMVSSNIGMMELPYKALPFHTDGYDLNTRMLEATEDFKHPVLMISGGKTDRDVMRGEETQLAGCAPAKGNAGQLFLFPGTHSKHIFVKDQSALSFKTYMTGEFFSLLSRNSILSGSVRESEPTSQQRSQGNHSLAGAMLKSFEDGVGDAIHTNLLNSAFLVRTNSLFEKYTREENYYYLSGLLTGTELRDLRGSAVETELKDLREPPPALTVVGDETQKTYYLAALRKLGIPGVQFQDAAQAVVSGHCKIYRQYK